MIPICVCPIRLLVFKGYAHDSRLFLQARRMNSNRFFFHLNNYEGLIIKIKINNVGLFRIRH
jgi:hypothetical protein